MCGPTNQRLFLEKNCEHVANQHYCSEIDQQEENELRKPEWSTFILIPSNCVFISFKKIFLPLVSVGSKWSNVYPVRFFHSNFWNLNFDS